jgi:hypothetical protein
MAYEVNIARTSLKNPINYDATSSGILACVQSVTSLIRSYGCAETISEWEKTWIFIVVSTEAALDWGMNSGKIKILHELQVIY